MSQGGSRSPRARHRDLSFAGELGVAALIVTAVGLPVRLYGPTLAHDLRERLLLLTPFRALELIAAVMAIVIVTTVVSAKRGGRRAIAGLRRPGHACLTTLARVPAVAGLTGIVALAAGFRTLLGRAATEPRVLGDELVYSGLAKSLALSAQPLFRGELDIGHSILYPLLLSPAYRLASDGAAAYVATKQINAVVVALAAVPTYMLARRVVSHGWSLGVAALVAIEPWTAYSSLAMTESLFLPVFTAFALALARMLERPTRLRQLVVLGMLLVLLGIRPQALALVVSVLAAIAIQGRLARSLRQGIAAHGVVLGGLGLSLAAGFVAIAAGQQVPGGSARELVSVVDDPFRLTKWALWNLAVYELALGVIVLAVFPLALRGLIRRTASDAERSLGIAALTLSAGLLLSVAVLSASASGLAILHERNLFYATPLVLVCAAHWLTTGLRRTRALAASAALAAVALPALLPTDLVLRTNNVDSPTAAWLHQLHDASARVPLHVWTVGLAGLAAIALLTVRRPLVPLLSVTLAFAALVAALDYSGPFSPSQDRRLAWVDNALPKGATATLVHLGLSRPDQPCSETTDYEQQGLIVWTEFFNTSITRVVRDLEQVERDHLDSPRITVEAGGVVHEDGVPFAPAYAVLDSRQPVVGRRLARLDLAKLGSQFQEGASLTLWHVEPPLRFLAHAQPLPPRASGAEC